jgi:hypothetical protein
MFMLSTFLILSQSRRLKMENNIRKQWLISFILITVSTCLSGLFAKSLLGVLFIFFIASLGSITYYLGYMKHNALWLTVIVSFRSLSLLVSLAYLIFLVFTKQLMSFSEKATEQLNISPIGYLVIWTIGVLASAYYTYRCYQLRLLYIKKTPQATKKKKTA